MLRSFYNLSKNIIVNSFNKDLALLKANNVLGPMSLLGRSFNKKVEQEVMRSEAEELDLTKEIITKVNDQITSNNYGRLFAVVRLIGRQYLITTEDLIVIPVGFEPTNGDQIRLEKVLAVGGRDFTLVGRPVLPKDLVRVEATVVEKTLDATTVRIKYLKRNKPIQRKDVEPGREGGTWLGATNTGKIACLLNLFQSKEEFKQSGAARGFLAVDFLLKNVSSRDYVEALSKSEVDYNPFNLVLLEMKAGHFEAVFYNSKERSLEELEQGTVLGFGNCFVSRPFRKVEKGRKEMQKVVEMYGTKDKKELLIEALFSMMRDEEQLYPDDVLRDQGGGHSEALVRGLASIWVSIPQLNYGTRTTTIITVDAENHLSFHERTMKYPSPSCTEFEENNYKFRLA